VISKIGITSQSDEELVENEGKKIKFKTRLKNIVSSELQACALDRNKSSDVSSTCGRFNSTIVKNQCLTTSNKQRVNPKITYSSTLKNIK